MIKRKPVLLPEDVARENFYVYPRDGMSVPSIEAYVAPTDHP